MQGLQLRPRVSGLASAIAWLRDHGVAAKRIGNLFEVTELHARQLAFRGRRTERKLKIPTFLEDPFIDPVHSLGPVSDPLRSRLHIRTQMESWGIAPSLPGPRLTDLEERIEQVGTSFWSGVRHGLGISRFGPLLIEIGRPSHFRRIRLLARLRQMIAETYAHAGYSSSAIEQGLTAMLLSRAAYQDSVDPIDLEQFAKTALIVSQAHLLRHEPEQAKLILDLHKGARERIHAPLGGEYFRQQGAIAFQLGPDLDEKARGYFKRAARTLAATVEHGLQKQLYEVMNIGQRQMNLLGSVNWEASQELLAFMLNTLPSGEIQISMNVNWTAACGLSTDSPSANLSAMEFLGRHSEASVGFGHQATVAWLLRLTPDLPKEIRPLWVRRALYENTFRDR